MKQDYLKSLLFQGMTPDEVEKCLEYAEAKFITYEKNEQIFTQLDVPKALYLLIDGAVQICRDSVSGKRGIVTTIDSSGDMFGEVYVFLKKGAYDFYTVAEKRSTVLEIPKTFFYNTKEDATGFHARLTQNMLSILSGKAYYLNQKLQILSSGSLRQKIAKYLLGHRAQDGTVALNMNREAFADFLSTARPSLSRELLNMQKDGFICLQGKSIQILDVEALEEAL